MTTNYKKQKINYILYYIRNRFKINNLIFSKFKNNKNYSQMNKWLRNKINSLFSDKKKLYVTIGLILIFIIIIIIIIIFNRKTNTPNEHQEKEFIPSICYDSKDNPSKNCLGGWFYRVRNKTSEKNAKFAKSHNWNYVLLSSNVKTEESKKLLKDNIKSFNENNISVHIMCLEDTVYINNPISAYNEISSILDYINKENLTIKGIHIDCEPHGIGNWSSLSKEGKNDIFDKWLKVIENSRKAINEKKPNITFSGAVAWWYPRNVKEGILKNGRGYDLVQKNRFDFIFPMIYDGAGGTVEKVIEKSNDYINDGAYTVIGIGIEEYEYNKFDSVINGIFEIRNESKFFSGVSVYPNYLYPDWDSY